MANIFTGSSSAEPRYSQSTDKDLYISYGKGLTDSEGTFKARYNMKHGFSVETGHHFPRPAAVTCSGPLSAELSGIW
jgi:hypothetical protein